MPDLRDRALSAASTLRRLVLLPSPGGVVGTGRVGESSEGDLASAVAGAFLVGGSIWLVAATPSWIVSAGDQTLSFEAGSTALTLQKYRPLDNTSSLVSL